MAADRESARRLLALGRPRPGTGGEPVRVRVRALGGAAVSLRPGTSDAQVFWDTFAGGYHRPPPALVRPETAARIWDLGANVGLTAADLAARFPRARLLAVELDAGNARLCRANLAPWADRCDVLRAAVWPLDGEVAYELPPGGEYGARVRPDGGGSLRAAAVSPATLLAREGDEEVDFVKMDIEGAERDVLRDAGGWAGRVRCLLVEVHEPYTVAACRSDLEAAGFATEVARPHWASVLAFRR